MGEGEASMMEMGEGESGEKFRRGNEASEMREQMEKQRRKREKKPQFYVWNCTVAVLQKNLQYCCLQFSNAIVFRAANAK